jgi:hypothetical protein
MATQDEDRSETLLAKRLRARFNLTYRSSLELARFLVLSGFTDPAYENDYIEDVLDGLISSFGRNYMVYPKSLLRMSPALMGLLTKEVIGLLQEEAQRHLLSHDTNTQREPS